MSLFDYLFLEHYNKNEIYQSIICFIFLFQTGVKNLNEETKYILI